MKTLGERIREARESTGMTAAEFSRAIGVGRAAVSKMEKDQTRTIQIETASEIERITGYSAKWIALGRGSKKGQGRDAEIERLANSIESLPPEHRAKIEAEIEFLLSLGDKTQ